MRACRKTAQMLTVSVISMMICGVMLLDTTLAWFQETVTASVTITAETVSVALLDAERDMKPIAFYEVLLDENEAGGESLTTLNTEPNVVWDLNKAYQTPPMTLVNTGSLKTEYTISVEGIEDSLKEAFVFEVLLEGGESQAMPFKGNLGVEEGDSTVSFSIRAHLNADKAATVAGANLENIVMNIIAVQVE